MNVLEIQASKKRGGGGEEREDVREGLGDSGMNTPERSKVGTPTSKVEVISLAYLLDFGFCLFDFGGDVLL